jgi:hypothetical protein
LACAAPPWRAIDGSSGGVAIAAQPGGQARAAL